jgi:mRNA-degrading endonuclease RelE of RelBE toxin-antitoxin system
MVFVETPVFTAQLIGLLNDEEYSGLQHFLMRDPDAGDLIPESGGLRKVRWSARGKGKRGGVRVIYYFVDQADQIRFLLIYRKGAKDDLTRSEKKQLRTIKDRWA